MDQFESFICVMEKFGGENNNIVVKRIAEDIRLILSEPAVKHSSVQYSSTDKIPGTGRCVMFMNAHLFGNTLVIVVFMNQVFIASN